MGTSTQAMLLQIHVFCSLIFFKVGGEQKLKEWQIMKFSCTCYTPVSLERQTFSSEYILILSVILSQSVTDEIKSDEESAHLKLKLAG